MRASVAALSAAVFATLAVLAGCTSDPPVAGHQGPSLAEQQQAHGAPTVAGYEVSLPSIGARSDLVALGLNPDRSVQVPALDDVGQIGWYQGSPRPGEVGPSALYGHINGRGKPGVFARLAEVKAGDRVDVTTPAGPKRFVVYRTQVVPKSAFPTEAVYGNTAGPELHLVSCGGTYDKANRNYLDQILVFAREDA